MVLVALFTANVSFARSAGNEEDGVAKAIEKFVLNEKEEKEWILL